MSVALSATIQQNSHSKFEYFQIEKRKSIRSSSSSSSLDSNNLMNPSMPNLTPAECRQSEELNNQMMNCLR